MVNSMRKEDEKKEIEISQLQSMNENLKKKLEESMKSLETNA